MHHAVGIDGLARARYGAGTDRGLQGQTLDGTARELADQRAIGKHTEVEVAPLVGAVGSRRVESVDELAPEPIQLRHADAPGLSGQDLIHGVDADLTGRLVDAAANGRAQPPVHADADLDVTPTDLTSGVSSAEGLEVPGVGIEQTRCRGVAMRLSGIQPEAVPEERRAGIPRRRSRNDVVAILDGFHGP